MWVETRSFDASAPVGEVIEWAAGKLTRFPQRQIGNLRLQIDEASYE